MATRHSGFGSVQHPFQLQEVALHRYATTIADQCACTAHQSMTRHQDRHRISSIRGPNRPCGVRVANTRRDLTIRSDLAIGNPLRGVPNVELKRRSAEVHGHGEGLALASKIGLKLTGQLSYFGYGADHDGMRQPAPDPGRTHVWRFRTPG